MNKDKALHMALKWFGEYQSEYSAKDILQACKLALECSDWKSLTNDEIRYLDDVTLGDYYNEQQATKFARSIEQMLRIKNEK